MWLTPGGFHVLLLFVFQPSHQATIAVFLSTVELVTSFLPRVWNRPQQANSKLTSAAVKAAGTAGPSVAFGVGRCHRACWSLDMNSPWSDSKSRHDASYDILENAERDRTDRHWAGVARPFVVVSLSLQIAL